ncbi:MAG: hypothetical protein M1819_001501 [Sarea resinae]|nr:MAG: hypothetical protein M1819_001501 [Sarea resinae]
MVLTQGSADGYGTPTLLGMVGSASLANLYRRLSPDSGQSYLLRAPLCRWGLTPANIDAEFHARVDARVASSLWNSYEAQVGLGQGLYLPGDSQREKLEGRRQQQASWCTAANPPRLACSAEGESFCDLQKDSCGQCARATLLCSGYRDTEQLRIRDESQTTKQKALTRAAVSIAVPQTITTTIDERARAAFFSHYVSGFSKTYDVLERLYVQPRLDSHLEASIDAVSLAIYDLQCRGSMSVSQRARQKYSLALPLLNQALRSASSATSDSTLLAVLLLDLFEKLTNTNPRSTASWMSHVNGALALVKLRDAGHLQTYTGRRLSVRLSTNLLISCVAANAPVPPALLKLRADLAPFLDGTDPKWRVSGLVLQYAHLQGAIQDRRLTDPEDIVARAAELDHRFLSLAQSMPARWRYRTTYLEAASERVFEQRFDTYADHFTTQTWNVLRVMRIFLNDLMRTHCVNPTMTATATATTKYSAEKGGEDEEEKSLPLRPPHPATTTTTTTATIDALAQAICFSAPQFTISSSVTVPPNPSPSPQQRLANYTLLFPLYVAALYASPASPIRAWVTAHLRFLDAALGIRNAGVVAGILERGGREAGEREWEGERRGVMGPWDVYAVLGSYAFAA